MYIYSTELYGLLLPGLCSLYITYHIYIFFFIVCFTSYFVFHTAVLPHSPGVVYYHLVFRRETRIPRVAPFSFRIGIWDLFVHRGQKSYTPTAFGKLWTTPGVRCSGWGFVTTNPHPLSTPPSLCSRCDHKPPPPLNTSLSLFQVRPQTPTPSQHLPLFVPGATTNPHPLSTPPSLCSRCDHKPPPPLNTSLSLF